MIIILLIGGLFLFQSQRSLSLNHDQQNLVTGNAYRQCSDPCTDTVKKFNSVDPGSEAQQVTYCPSYPPYTGKCSFRFTLGSGRGKYAVAEVEQDCGKGIQTTVRRPRDGLFSVSSTSV